MAETLPVRVMVPEVWDEIRLDVSPETPVGTLKTEALQRARVMHPAERYLLKYRGAEVLDENQTLAQLEVPAGAPFIVMNRRRRPTR